MNFVRDAVTFAIVPFASPIKERFLDWLHWTESLF